jgi:hypothetical protein
MDVAVGLALAVGGALGLAEGLPLGECPVLTGVAGTAEGSSEGTGAPLLLGSPVVAGAPVVVAAVAVGTELCGGAAVITTSVVPGPGPVGSGFGRLRKNTTMAPAAAASAMPTRKSGPLR